MGLFAPGPAEIAAQQWHDEQQAEDSAHDQFSSCWCCCIDCNPNNETGRGNPHFRDAAVSQGKP